MRRTAKERGLTLASDFTYEQVAQPCDGGLMGELEAATQAVHGKVPKPTFRRPPRRLGDVRTLPDGHALRALPQHPSHPAGGVFLGN